jgi:hypothetical protein
MKAPVPMRVNTKLQLLRNPFQPVVLGDQSIPVRGQFTLAKPRKPDGTSGLNLAGCLLAASYAKPHAFTQKFGRVLTRNVKYVL